MAKETSVVLPNLGLYYDRPAIAMDPRMLQEGLNFRVKEGTLNNLNLGWEQFSGFTLNGAVLVIDSFQIRGGVEQLIFATPTDLYAYNAADDDVVFITPIYATGTVAVAGTAVTGTGTNWSPTVKAGDFFVSGAADQNDPTANWIEIQTVTDDTNIVLASTGGTVGAGASYTIRRTFTGDESDVWTYDVFLGTATDDDLWLASNGVDDLVTWNGTDDFATLQDAFGITKIKSIVTYTNMVVYGGFEQAGELFPSSIINSDAGDPLDITTGISEQFKAHAQPDGITAMYPLGDNLIIYSPYIIVVAQFVGDPLIFIFRTAASTSGPLSPNSIADYGDRHVFLGFDSMYDFDGVTLNETSEHVFREVIRRNDPFRRHFAFAHFDEENGDLLWIIAQTGDAGAGDAQSPAEQAYVQHYLEEVPQELDYPCSRRECPFTSAGYFFRQSGLTWDQIAETWEQLNFRWNDQFFASAFPLNLFGSADGKVYTLNTSQNKPGSVGFNSFVRFPRKATGDGRMRGLVRRIYPFVEQFQNNLNVTLLLADHAMGPATITNLSVFDQALPEGGHFVSPFRRGRFFWVQFGTDGVSLPWQLSGFDVDVTPGGLR